jgi:hypothetical protein
MHATHAFPPNHSQPRPSFHRDISLQLVASPSLWALAFSQGRDFVSFLRAFKAMRTGFSTGSFRYGIAAFNKGTEELQ